MTKGYGVMLGISLVVTAISVAGLGYIFSSPPAYLKSDRDGVPFFTPDVIHMETGEPVSVGELIRNFKGE